MKENDLHQTIQIVFIREKVMYEANYDYVQSNSMIFTNKFEMTPLKLTQFSKSKSIRFYVFLINSFLDIFFNQKQLKLKKLLVIAKL